MAVCVGEWSTLTRRDMSMTMWTAEAVFCIVGIAIKVTMAILTKYTHSFSDKQ